MNHDPRFTNQSGVATILAIGITALLLCLAIAYVTTSIVEKKAATNYQSMITARIAAQTAFNRAIAQIKDASTNPLESFNQIVSHRVGITSWTNADTKSLVTKLTTVISGDTYYSLPSDYPTGYTATDSNAVSWIYLRSNQADSQIIGRIAYVVIPDKGKIDPWSVIDSGVNAATYHKTPPSEENYGASNYTSVDASGNYVIGRPGRDLTELCLKSLETDSPSLFPSTYTQQMSVKTCNPVGLVDTGSAGDWVDFEQLFSKLGILASDSAKRSYFRKVFYVNAQPEPEAFWIDISNDSIRDPSELYHRFNLTRTDWNNIKVDSFLNANAIPFSFPLTGESNYLPWLKNWQDIDPDTRFDRRRQIIANLIDYCKTTVNATTDSPDNPTYVGLEKCPYTNEIRLQLPIKVDRTSAGTPVIYTYTLKQENNFKVRLELVNMYKSNFTTPFNAEIKINFALKITSDPSAIGGSTWTYGPTTVNLSFSKIDNQRYDDQEYTFRIKPPDPTLTFLTFSSVTTVYCFIYIFNLTVKLTDSATGQLLYDYSNINSDTGAHLIASGDNDFTKDYKVDFQVSDPRQNLHPTDWLCQYNNDGTFGNNNDNFPTTFTGSDTDPERNDADRPWKLSTAFIRKGPMQSPWELGLIHRGRAFQTLNLKKYNNLASNGYGFGINSGGGAYSAGDANILDQIKMTANTTTLGKININSDNQSVLRTLFDHIRLGCKLEDDPNPDPGGGGNVIDVTDANTVADSIRAANGSQGTGTPFFTRASVVNAVPYLSTVGLGITRDNDAKQEELIGKFINLTKAEFPNQYIVIAVGEAIRNVGETNNEVLASQKILAIIRRKIDPVTGQFNKFYILRMMYLSD